MSDNSSSLRKPAIFAVALVSLLVGLVLFGPKTAQAATPVSTNTMPVEGVLAQPPGCVYASERQSWWFYVRNTGSEVITVFVRPSSAFGSGHSYAAPSLRGSIEHGLYWPVRLGPKEGKFLRVDYTMPGTQYTIPFWVSMYVTVDGRHGSLYYSITSDSCDPANGSMK
ncbi:MAG: hypothetical protein Q7R60_00845 [bacterium]|nr:hypothetical protein [bacterium]